MKNVFVEERVLGYQKIVSTYRKRILSFKYAVPLKKECNLKTRFLVLKMKYVLRSTFRAFRAFRIEENSE